MIETWEINGHAVEFIEETHTYLVDGVIVPSITQILKHKFRKKYDCVDKEVLQRASNLGTATHKAIEEFCKLGIVSELLELKNFMFLQKHFGFKVVDNEVVIILFYNDVPVACGRLDLLLMDNGDLCIGDIKRTSSLDKEYLAYQLNLYRIGFQQCYGTEIKGLKGLHLKDNVRKYVDIPINENMAIDLLRQYIERDNKDE